LYFKILLALFNASVIFSGARSETWMTYLKSANEALSPDAAKVEGAVSITINDDMTSKKVREILSIFCLQNFSKCLLDESDD